MNLSKTFYFFLLLWLLPFTVCQLNAQGWERTYGTAALESGHAIAATPDGGYLLSGTAERNGQFDLYAVKVDVNGQTDWQQSFGSPNTNEFGRGAVVTPDGGYVLLSTNGGNGETYIELRKTDQQGNTLWIFQSRDSTEGRALFQYPDGRLVVAGAYLGAAQSQAYLLQAGAGGSLIWEQAYLPGELSSLYDVRLNTANEIMAVGFVAASSVQDLDLLLLSADEDGNLLWDRSFGEAATAESGFGLSPLPGGDWAVVGRAVQSGVSEANLLGLRTDQSGNQIWLQEYPRTGRQEGLDVAGTANGEVLIIGLENSPTSQDNDLAVWRLAANGDIQWQKLFGGVEVDEGQALLENASHQLVLLGSTRSFGAGDSDAYLLLADSLGQTFSNKLSGQLYFDEDMDCQRDPGEQGVSGWVLKAEGSRTFYTTTDSAGQYAFDLDTGTYIIQVVAPNDYWMLCTDSLSVSFSQAYDTLTADFGIKAAIHCPQMQVSVGTPLLRRCFPNTYTLSYCNAGPDTAREVFVEIELDQWLQLDSASAVYTDLGAHLYRFELPDQAPFDCGEIKLHTYLDCDSTVLGQAHCVTAHIYPDSICSPVDSLWDGSGLEIDAVCAGDSVVFTVRNFSDEQMTVPSAFVIIEDQIMLRQGTITLPGMEDSVFVEYPQGRTLRMEVAQVSGYPGQSHPIAVIEGCGGPPISTGFVYQRPMDDEDPFVDIDCRENIGSYDPNVKAAFPTGFGAEQWIEPDTDIEYLIHFQNTGNDTAFRVVIRDTLSSLLMVEAVQLGAASHPYTFSLYNERVLEFTFDDIQLPDSSSNELASHGFVSYRIPQTPGNPGGRFIFNSADIYFDYNSPVLTNRYFHKIKENYVTMLTQVQTIPELIGQLSIYPNPSRDEVTIALGSEMQKNIEVMIYSMDGREVFYERHAQSTFAIRPCHLPSGMYLLVLKANGKTIGRAKMIRI